MLPTEIGNGRLSRAARLAAPLVFTLGGVAACGPSQPEARQLLPANPALSATPYRTPTISLAVTALPPHLPDESATPPPPDDLASTTFPRPAKTPLVAIPFAEGGKPTEGLTHPTDAVTTSASVAPDVETAVAPAVSSLPQNTRPAVISPRPPAPPRLTESPTETTLPPELTRIGQTLEDQKQTSLDELLDEMISVYGIHVTDAVEAGIGEPFDTPATAEQKRLVVATFHSMPDGLKQAAKNVYQSSGALLIIRLQIADEIDPQVLYQDDVVVTVPNSLTLSPLEKPVSPREPLSDSEKLVQEIMYGLGQALLDIQSKQSGVMPIALQWATQFYPFWPIGPDQQTLQNLETIFGRPIKNSQEHIAASLARLALYRFGGLSNDLNPFAVEQLFPDWPPGVDYLNYLKNSGQ